MESYKLDSAIFSQFKLFSTRHPDFSIVFLSFQQNPMKSFILKFSRNAKFRKLNFKTRR